MIQYNAALAITGCIRGTSKSKIFHELSLERLSDRRWLNKLSLFYKITRGLVPSYLAKVISVQKYKNVSTRSVNVIRTLRARTEFFYNSYFPFVIREWNKLDPSIQSSDSINILRSKLLKFIRPVSSSTFKVQNSRGLVYLTRLRLGLSHLKEHKFNHNFEDTVDPICICRTEVETTSHYFLRCQLFSNQRIRLLNDTRHVRNDPFHLEDEEFVKVLLFGKSSLNLAENRSIILATINFILESNRFNESFM